MGKESENCSSNFLIISCSYSLISSAALLTNLLHVLFRFLLLVSVLTNQTSLQRQLLSSLTDHGPPSPTGHVSSYTLKTASVGPSETLESIYQTTWSRKVVSIPRYSDFHYTCGGGGGGLRLRIYTKTCWARCALIQISRLQSSMHTQLLQNVTHLVRRRCHLLVQNIQIGINNRHITIYRSDL
jgi:hypothetical protein